ncbi:MAG: DUF2723 domain-containing protein [candidate division Zixibacteria bacterium]|nr:DUF2723 domain-containing protein [candidate division Zixibacteria bacterium]
MRKIIPQNFDLTNFWVGFGVWLSTLVVYLLTLAPTVSFWDCGEFITVSYILGIPHPPGTPLYVLIGRLFALVPTFVDFSARINLLSAVSSSLTALFGYLATVRILGLWFTDTDSLYNRILIYGGSACGAFFLAFGVTQWSNSVEAEVYGLALLMMLVIVWLTLIYYRNWGTALADRVMLLIVYLAFLGIGVHMTVLAILPVAALFFILKKDTPLKFWFLVAVFFFMEFYLIFALSSRPGEVPFYVPIIITFIVYAFYVFSFENIPGYLLLVGLGFLLAIAPVYTYIIRAVMSGLGAQTGAVADVPAWLSTFGTVTFVIMILYALYNLYRYLNLRKHGGLPDNHLLISSLFVLITGFMVGILVVDFRGYTSFMILSAFLLFVLGIFAFRYIRWPILAAIVGAFMVVIGIIPFIYGLAAALVVILVLGLMFKMPGWRAALMILLVTVTGFSVHLFIPIRSAQDPFINENNPSESIQTTINFLERRQYGSQSMIPRMFTRRAEWANQFGDFRRMGFWNFFNEQYGLPDGKFFVLFVIGLYGLWEIIRRRPRPGLFLLILILISSVGLVLYMNFADGTRQHPITGADYIEVRDRDYFFTPAFVLYGLAIGLGMTMLINSIREMVSGFSTGPRKLISVSLLVLLLTPCFPLAKNYYRCDRSNNYIPFDYAWNLLNSADQNAVLFTNADNDTFPVWCLQLVYGVRTDVKMVNLSLANTDWYIKQVRDYLRLNLPWNDEQIKALRPYRLQDGRTFRLNNQLVDAVIDNNTDRLPINFSITTSSTSRQYHGFQIDSLLELSGFKWYIKEHGPRMTVNVEESMAILTDTAKVRLRSLDDPSVYKDEAALRTTLNIASSYSIVADTLKRAGRYEEAEKVALIAAHKIPHATDPVHSLASIYAAREDTAKLAGLIGWAQAGDKKYMRCLLGSTKFKMGREGEAEIILKGVLQEYPSYRQAFEELVRIYIKNEQAASLDDLLQTWLRHNPDDSRTRQFLSQLREKAKELSDNKNKNK